MPPRSCGQQWWAMLVGVGHRKRGRGSSLDPRWERPHGQGRAPRMHTYDPMNSVTWLLSGAQVWESLGFFCSFLGKSSREISLLWRRPGGPRCDRTLSHLQPEGWGSSTGRTAQCQNPSPAELALA